MKRIGIDVGGTFTHGVLLNEAEQVEARARVLTTHTSKQGVTEGVIAVLDHLWEGGVQQISFSTTQVTNALLEGDLSTVGIVLYAPHLFSKLYFSLQKPFKLRAGGKIFLAKKYILSDPAELDELLPQWQAQVQAFCISSLFPQDQSWEEEIYQRLKSSLPTTASSFLSSLYGFAARTRTAFFNASLLPVQQENMKGMIQALQARKISTPLLVMRSDGGALTVREAKERPLLTLLSGPAAGVAAACYFLGVYQGIFVECGGTSTDISFIRDGRAKLAKAKVGDHLLQVRTLDIHTQGVAGGSMAQLKQGEIVSVGPRSAHIAGLAYASLTEPDKIKGSKLFLSSPKAGDPAHYLSFGQDRPSWTITPSCCANYLLIKEGKEPLFGNRESILKAFEIAEAETRLSKLAEKILSVAVQQLAKKIREISLGSEVELIGGGGSAPVFLPRLAKELGLHYRIADEHTVISAIGAAMGLLKESVERQVSEINEEEIKQAKADLVTKLSQKGVSGPFAFEVEVDHVRKRLFVAATAERRADRKVERLSNIEGKKIIFEGKVVNIVQQGEKEQAITDKAGHILLAAPQVHVEEPAGKAGVSKVDAQLDKLAQYDDAGVHYPPMHLFANGHLYAVPSAKKAEMLTVFQSHLHQLNTENYAVIFSIH